MPTADNNLRIYLLQFTVLATAAILIGRLFFVQIIDGEFYRLEASRQYQETSQWLYDRGSIYFKEKDGQRVRAATLSSGYLLAINPGLVENPSRTFSQLKNYLTLDEIEFLNKARLESDPYEEVARRLDEKTARAIKGLGLEGVGIFPERWRAWPAGRLASHVLGFVGFNTDTFEGRYGVERQYENVLVRRESNLYENFFAQVFAGIGDVISGRGGDVVLTIEPTVQKFSQKVLAEIKEHYQADQAGLVIVDPMSGEITAMAALPDFDPNNFSAEDDLSVFSNPLVEEVYEMGSIFKPLTLAAGLDQGVIDSQTTYFDAGTVTIEGEEVSNYDKKGRGQISMQEVLNQSLNTGAVFVMRQLGQDNFKRYIYAFGLSEKTGIDLPGEVAGLIENLENGREIESATASFGQGVAVTPISLVRALSALANGGYLYKPHITASLSFAPGLNDQIEPVDQGHVISQATSEEITRMLVRTVDEALVGGRAKLEHYRIAAKTGTAQIPDLQSGGYYENRYLHSFFGYFPAYKPRFLVLIYMVDPKGVRFASETLTDPFMEITKFLIEYYEVPPDR